MKSYEAETNKSDKQPIIRLAFFWQSQVSIKMGVGSARPLTPKEMGQLKLLRQSLGDETINVIEWAVSNWASFSQQARAEAGLSCAPANPHVGFLLVHYPSAVNMMLKVVPEQVAGVMAAYHKRMEELKLQYEP